MYLDLFKELKNLSENQNEMCNCYFPEATSAFPLVNLYETNEELKLIAPLPGVNPEKLDVNFVNGILTISGNKEDNREKGLNFIRSEREFGSFSKSVKIGAKVNHNDINATYKDGILEIGFKISEEKKPKKVEIKTN